MNKRTVSFLLTTALIVTACTSPSTPECPAGFICVPNTPDPFSTTALPENTPTPFSTPFVGPTQMLDSLAAFGIKLKFAFQLLGWQEYWQEYEKAGWSTTNPDCLVRADGILEASGNSECLIFPHPGLRVATVLSKFDKPVVSFFLGSYGGFIELETPIQDDEDKPLVVFGFE